ncbi:MAG: arginase [Flavobacteriaceae bacterium]|nr:MAG: arginase [Flavobacteriaceae bacterium]
MELDFLKPVDTGVLTLSQQILGNNLSEVLLIHTEEEGMPILEGVKIAIVGVCEGRNAVDNEETGNDFSSIRKHLYAMFPGNWGVKVADIGDVVPGNTVADTYFAVKSILSSLLKKGIIPVIIGGGQELTYINYRAYDALEQTVNLVSVDNKFNLGVIDNPIDSTSFLSRVIMDEPNNLFNYCNLGYQTFYNSQDEIDLLENLYFETHRLGELLNNIEIVEPVLRDADIVSFDLSVIKNCDAPANNNATPNGLSGTDACAIARYAGISDKVTSFGIYEFNALHDAKQITGQLIAQMIWYFIEGVNYRANDYPFGILDDYQKYIVPTETETMNFYKSNKSGRWWMEINLNENNKFKRHALIPCTYQDYLSAINQELPERWMKACKKLS